MNVGEDEKRDRLRKACISRVGGVPSKSLALFRKSTKACGFREKDVLCLRHENQKITISGEFRPFVVSAGSRQT